MKAMYAVLVSPKGEKPIKIRHLSKAEAQRHVIYCYDHGIPAKYLGVEYVRKDGTSRKRNGKPG
jgi:hypothetical protein